MAIIELRADGTKLGELICEWDENTALLLIRRQAEETLRELLKLLEPLALSELPTEVEIQKGLDELMVEAEALFEKYAPEIFFHAQFRLVYEVMSKILLEIPKSIHVRSAPGDQEQIACSMAKFIDKRLFRDHRDWMSKLFKAKHNELIGVKPGPEAQVSIEEIVQCLQKLPKGASLVRLAAEMNLAKRTIQHTLKAAGFTFKEAKRKAQQ